MASAEDIASLGRKQTADAESSLVLPKLPKLPKAVKERFPELQRWETEMEEWRQKAEIRIRGQV